MSSENNSNVGAILTGIAAIITAIGGVILVMKKEPSNPPPTLPESNNPPPTLLEPNNPPRNSLPKGVKDYERLGNLISAGQLQQANTETIRLLSKYSRDCGVIDIIDNYWMDYHGHDLEVVLDEHPLEESSRVKGHRILADCW